MSLFQHSEISLRTGRQIVLDSSGLTDSDVEATSRAERAIRWAFKKWNSACRWDWTRVLDESQVTVSGTNTYSLPYDFGTMYTVRLGDKIIKPIDRRLYDRATSSLTGLDTSLQGYDMLRRGTGGIVEFLPSIDASDTTIRFKYFRKLLAPTYVTASGLTLAAVTATGSVQITSTSAVFGGIVPGTPMSFSTSYASGLVTSTNTPFSVNFLATATAASATGVTVTAGGLDMFLDIPSDYVEGALSLASWYYLINKGGEARGDRIEQHKALAAEVLKEALRNNFNYPDADEGFVPGQFAGIALPGPDAVWPYRDVDGYW